MYSYEANGRGNTSATDAKLLERKSQFINLPAVTPEDNGKVLGVDNGKWQPVNGGGWPSDLPKPSEGSYGYTEYADFHETSDLHFEHDYEAPFFYYAAYINDFPFDKEPVSAYFEVELDGKAYQLELQPLESGGCYLGEVQNEWGWPVFDNYPFLIIISNNTAKLYSSGETYRHLKLRTVVPHKINPQYLPEDGFGWTEKNIKTLIPETTFTADQYGQASIASNVDFAQLYETYTDQTALKGKVNGVDCVVEIEYDYDGGVYDMYIYAVDSIGIQLKQGEFDKTSFYATGMDEGETYTIEMYVDNTVVHKIDPKYLGGGGVLDDFMVVNITTYPEIVIDKTYDEIQNANKVFAVLDNRIAQVYMTGGLVVFVSLMSVESTGLVYRLVYMPQGSGPYVEEKDVPFTN